MGGLGVSDNGCLSEMGTAPWFMHHSYFFEGDEKRLFRNRASGVSQKTLVYPDHR
jgi:hypothetical protein